MVGLFKEAEVAHAKAIVTCTEEAVIDWSTGVIKALLEAREPLVETDAMP